MKPLLTGLALFGATISTIVLFPTISAGTSPTLTPITPQQPPIIKELISTAPAIDAVFVLDTTSSMGGLIETAKEKIWSIATTMASAQQSPDIRIGLVAFRDRGDSYVTYTIDLSDDLDSVYSSLMDFEALGGGDGPESVNKGLYDAVNGISWSQNPNAYQTIFLVGDAPPHMDYRNDVKYSESVKIAREKGIIINTILCGNNQQTKKVWTDIAQQGYGKFFQVEQSGGSLAINTPYDEQLAKLSAKLDGTRLYYGNKQEKEKMRGKTSATEKLHAESSIASQARRSIFNMSKSGRKNSLGDKELVDAVTSGRVAVEEVANEDLPTELQSLPMAAKKEALAKLGADRQKIQSEIRELAEKRDTFIKQEVASESEADTLEYKLYEAIREQGDKSGLVYKEGPEY